MTEVFSCGKREIKPLLMHFLEIIVKQLEKPHAKHYQKTYEKEEFYANIV